MLFAGSAIFGLTTSLYGPTRFTVFTDVYTDRSGTALGLVQASGSLANTVMPVLGAAVASYASWRLRYGALVPVFVVVMLGLSV